MKLIGKFLPTEGKLTMCSHRSKRCKHCMKLNPGKSCTLYTVVHCLVLQRPAIKKAIGLLAVATFIFFEIYTLQAQLVANCKDQPSAFVQTCYGTALHNPTQYFLDANQENLNRLVCREYAYINRLKTTYVRYRKRLHTLFLYTSKRRFHRPSCLALLLLLLLLSGDVEVNPGPITSKERQGKKELDAGLIQDTSKEKQKREDSYKQLIPIESSGEQSMQSYCISIGSPLPIKIEQQYTTDIDKHPQAKKGLPINETEKRDQQLSKKRTLSRARFTAEKVSNDNRDF